MINYFQVIAGALVVVILLLIVGRQGKDMAVLLSIAACCMIVCTAAAYLEPVVQFVDKLQAVSSVDSQFLSILWKAVGVSLVSEIAALVCQDAGNQSLAKAVQMLNMAVVLWLSLPLMDALLTMVQKIVGEV